VAVIAVRIGLVGATIIAGRVFYAVALCVVDDPDPEAVGAGLARTLNRRRPLHWERDKGPTVRRSIVDYIATAPTRLHVGALWCGHKEQEQARERIIEELLVPIAVTEELDGWRLESRARDGNRRDIWTLRSSYRLHHARTPHIAQGGKTDPLLWLADAAVGAWVDLYLDRQPEWMVSLIGSGHLRTSTILS
jgi:hypothetical protein